MKSMTSMTSKPKKAERVTDDIDDMKSMTSMKSKHKKEESADYIGKGWMPIGPYKLAHPEARLTDEQSELLVNWLNPTD